MIPIRLFTCVTIAAAASPTAAQPGNANAEALFYQAKAYMAQRKYAEACAAFEASEKLGPKATTLLSLADCREKNSQLATAYAVYLQVERELRERSDDDSVELRELAKLRAVKLEPRLSKLTVNVPASAHVAGLEVLRGNERVEPGAWNQVQFVDGGTFRISARAPDRREWSTTVTLKPEGDAQSVDVPSLGARLIVTPTPAAAPPAPEPEADVETSEPAKRSPWRVHAVSIGLGAAALALGGGALGLELSARNVYDRTTTTTDPAEQDRLWESANTRRYLAAGLGVAALGCAGAAIYLYIDRRPTEAAVATRVVPVAGGGFAGLSLDGTW